MYKIAVVEDDKNSAEELKKNIERYALENGRDVEVAVYGNAVVFLEKFSAEYDILFIDICMPYMTGMEAAQKLRSIDSSVLIIFETSMLQYAVKGYSVNAFDFLLKPISYGTLTTTLARAFSVLDNREEKVIVIKTKGSYKKISLSELLFIEVSGHYLVYHTKNEEFGCWGSLGALERLLPVGMFARCNVGYIVNLSKVEKIDRNEVYIGDTSLHITRTHKKEFMEKFIEYLENTGGI